MSVMNVVCMEAVMLMLPGTHRNVLFDICHGNACVYMYNLLKCACC